MTSPPSVTLKLATSLDGRIAAANGESRWITGERAREKVHELRAEHDAVLVGSGTVLADDPLLTVRLPGFDRPQPLRIVADTRGRVGPDSLIAKSAHEAPVLVVVGDERAAASAEAFAGADVTVARGGGGDRIAPEAILGAAGEHGVKRVFLEGGGELAASFLNAGLIDLIEWFRAPIVLGGDGTPAVGALARQALSDAPRFNRVDVRQLGDDVWERYARR